MKSISRIVVGQVLLCLALTTLSCEASPPVAVPDAGTTDAGTIDAGVG